LAKEPAERAAAGQPGKAPPFFAFVECQDRIPLIMLMTPPHNLIVYGQGEDLDAAIDEGVSYLLREGVSPPGVIGPRDVATAFASSWQQRTGCALTVRLEQMIYRLDRVEDVAPSPGELIQATQAHAALAAEWLVGFAEVTLEPLDRSEALKNATRIIDASRLYLWQDEVPASMAWRARPTRHGIVVSGVYTPPEYRKRGYATSCVAALSQLLLDEGYQFCALYTDLANPTSNSIYQKIGYRPIQPSIVYGFDPPSREDP
jgi:predicted GNAT family acetyltransferase